MPARYRSTSPSSHPQVTCRVEFGLRGLPKRLSVASAEHPSAEDRRSSQNVRPYPPERFSQPQHATDNGFGLSSISNSTTSAPFTTVLPYTLPDATALHHRAPATLAVALLAPSPFTRHSESARRLSTLPAVSNQLRTLASVANTTHERVHPLAHAAYECAASHVPVWLLRAHRPVSASASRSMS